jgi:predicted esterase
VACGAAQEVAGVLLLSTFLGPDKTPQPAEVNKSVPWFWGHGDADPIVPFAMGKWTAQQLAKVRAALVSHLH